MNMIKKKIVMKMTMKMVAVTKQCFKGPLPLCHLFCELSEVALTVNQQALLRIKLQITHFSCAVPLPDHQKPPCRHSQGPVAWGGRYKLGPAERHEDRTTEQRNLDARLQDRPESSREVGKSRCPPTPGSKTAAAPLPSPGTAGDAPRRASLWGWGCWLWREGEGRRTNYDGGPQP